MKAIKSIITIIGVIIYHSLCNAQQRQVQGTPAQELAEHKKQISTIAYLFEGSVIQQKSYYMRHIRGAIYTCSVMKITKIFKGSPQIKLGTIKVISEGGSIDNGPNMLASNEGWVPIGKGSTYIIFGQPSTFEPADSNMLHLMATDNTITLLLCCGDPINFNGKGAAQWDEIKYNSLDSLYSFFKANGLTVQEETQQK